MQPVRQDWILLIILVGVGVWFLGEHLFRAIKLALKGTFWILRKTWAMVQVPTPVRKLEPQPKDDEI